MAPSRYKEISWAFICICAAALTFILIKALTDGKLFDLAYLFTKTSTPDMMVLIVLFVVSGLNEKLKVIHPTLSFLLCPVAFLDNPEAYMGLVVFATGVFLMVKYGYLRRYIKTKVVLLLLYLVISGLVPGALKGTPIIKSLNLPFVIVCFLFLTYIIFKEQIDNALENARKPVLNLAKFDVTYQEYQVVHTVILEGRSVKETASDLKLAVSTVHNKISSVYDKLGVEHSHSALVRHFTGFFVTWKETRSSRKLS